MANGSPLMLSLLLVFFLIYFANFNAQPVLEPHIAREYTERKFVHVVKRRF